MLVRSNALLAPQNIKKIRLEKKNEKNSTRFVTLQSRHTPTIVHNRQRQQTTRQTESTTEERSLSYATSTRMKTPQHSTKIRKFNNRFFFFFFVWREFSSLSQKVTGKQTNTHTRFT